MNTDFEVRKQTLINLGGNPDDLYTIYEVDYAIEEALRNGAGGWDCGVSSQSWYCTIGHQSWETFSSVGFISDSSRWKSIYGSYNVYTGDFNGLDAGNNGMCWFIGTTAVAKRNCKLVDGTNSYSWNSTIVKIDFPAEGYWCGKNSNGEMVYWLPADLAPTTTPTE